ncbi:hypothetical protein BD769DRAFT_1371943 [Suillus cothurnatus]|nr:hypothetical protein BD769DRAFT_1371943 [Suillus cothurnatus]
MNIDYSICNAIKHAAGNVDNSLIIYDVGCQWNLNFGQCVANCPGLALPDNTKIVAAVEKFHLSTHKLACFARYSLNFIQEAGQVDGEILETLWAPFNKISPTAQPTSSLDVIKVRVWKKDKEKAKNERGEHLDIYQLKIDKALTMAEMQLKLTKSECADTGKLGSISWFIDGINIEDLQYVVLSYINGDNIFLINILGCTEGSYSAAS